MNMVSMETGTYNSNNLWRGTLVRLAWRYGNEDNYFKLLPKEIIEVICSYGVNRPDWWDIAEYLIQHTIVNQLRKESSQDYKGIFSLAPFVWQHWARFSANCLQSFTTRLISNLPTAAEKQKDRMEKLLEWTSSIVARVNTADIFVQYSAYNFFKFIAANELALPLFKLVLSICGTESNIGYYLNPTATIQLTSPVNLTVIPSTWASAIMNNRPLIRYFMENGYMHLNDSNNDFARLEEMLRSYGADLSVLDYIRQLMQELAKK
eukprot:TRINITY_DN10927_c0_g1_i1.p1 TRINITY_DN10927_c0_g1~~TRINITY_DN10927_c0_g1_i1.p1  ORF type:complete len:264 (+),score=24.62 TRINITY_DN10927_c0_g1_i1:472-1263(+)